LGGEGNFAASFFMADFLRFHENFRKPNSHLFVGYDGWSVWRFPLGEGTGRVRKSDDNKTQSRGAGGSGEERGGLMNATDAGFSADPAIVRRRLSQYADFAPDEMAVLDGLGAGIERLPAGTELVMEHEKLNRPRVLLTGWGCTYRVLSDGRRQIFYFMVPGDFYGLSLRPHATALAGAVSLTPCTIAVGQGLGEAVLNRPEKHPGLVAACATAASLEQAWLLNQLTRVGRQTAYERLAHLFLELLYRFESVGLASANRFAMPLTQETIADAMGLSVVHLNRTLQQLRRDKLIEFRNGVVKLLQPDRLSSIGDFRAPKILRKGISH
jgi:CRP-like cAMP-binding protein